MRRPVTDLRRAIDPRLEWVHDKPIGPDRDQDVDVGIGVAWWIRAGGITVSSERGCWSAGPGDWVFLLPGRRHQAFKAGTRMWSIGYRFARPRGSPWYIGPDALVLRGGPALERAGRRLLSRVERASGRRPAGALFEFDCRPEDWLRIDAAFRLWLATAIATLPRHGARLSLRGQEDERVFHALSLLERDPWAASAGPAGLAATVGVSRRRLEQLFATTLGHGIAAERDRLRLEQAQNLLAQPELPVKRIASRLGFASSPAFSVWFRRHAGMPPRAYRQGMRPPAT